MGIGRVQTMKNTNKNGYVAYYRVSTAKQGESGLGLEAQREAVIRLAGSLPIHAEYTEVESGKKHTNRPELIAALAHARKLNATLLIAKLDRLARNVHFISGLMESKADFVAADMPQANRLTVHIMAAFAEHEREAISSRTKEALAAVKARGVKLGNPRWQESIKKAQAARQPSVMQSYVLEMAQEMHREGKSLRQIADRLNAMGLRTTSGAKFYASSIRNYLGRARPVKPATPQDVVELMKKNRGIGRSLRYIADTLNDLGLKTPSGARWYASSVSAALERAS